MTWFGFTVPIGFPGNTMVSLSEDMVDPRRAGYCAELEKWFNFASLIVSQGPTTIFVE